MFEEGKDYIIRTLNKEEYTREDLVKVFAENGVSVPDPNLSKIVIAETILGGLVGFYVLQVQYHAEPLWVKPEFRQFHIHKKLMKSMFDALKESKGLVIYCFSPSDKLSRLVERFGFKAQNWKVFKKEF